MPINTAVGETLRELRKGRGVSQETLAEAIGSHQVYISEIENGKKLPSLSVLASVAAYFGLSLSALVALVEAKIG